MERLLTAVNDAQGGVEGLPTTETAQPPEVNSEFRERRIRAEIEASQAASELEQTRAELAELQEAVAAEEFERELAAIKAAYPDEKAQSIGELGDMFLRICGAGVEPLIAYEVLRARRKRGKEMPPSTGDVNPVSGEAGEYFTPEQVRRMTPQQVKENYLKIRNSMKNWKE